MMTQENEHNLKQTATALLMMIWKGIPSDYKSKYRMTIWEQYEHEVKAAAYTSKLGKFINRICGRMNALIEIKEQDRVLLEEILNMPDERELLKLLREQATLLVLMVRMANQEIRDVWKEKMRVQELQNDLFEGEEN